MDTSFAVCLASARARRDMSASDLAKRSGIATTQISHFECGRREPSAGNLRKLAMALDVTTDYLLGLTGETRRIDPPVKRQSVA